MCDQLFCAKNLVSNNVDRNTIRIMVSTDNHLGFAEKDPVRGLDSFAAFEEVLLLAKLHKCDMVLLAGDLFHDNKPSRRTLYKTMEIIRRYCMGSDPVQFQILSDQARNFRNVYGTVNYEDPYYSVDLPIFTIHGNHDDPIRDGGTELLAALDLLAICNLVNYFGRNDQVDQVQVSPILLQKGTTRLAIYGMGNMRDERLNRMWRSHKVRFLKPVENKNVETDDKNNDVKEEWFNLFALHQNRDFGRGTKNCVHESMIPEWMDLIIWGHEHECQIECFESAVGTFRITQPGSSVATSLTTGEALRKHVGLLDIRNSQFRLTPIPLSQVRSFSVKELSLSNCSSLYPDDPNCEKKISHMLGIEVERLVAEAREQSRILHEDADIVRGVLKKYEKKSIIVRKPKFQVQKPDLVLVRLKVEHSGFCTLLNQRFGSRFLNEVANPSDILLFYRKRSSGNNLSGGYSTAKKMLTASKFNQPILPDELVELNVEDLIKDVLEKNDRCLEILNEEILGQAMKDFVSKEYRSAFDDSVNKMLYTQQKKLVKRGLVASDNENHRNDTEIIENTKIRTATAVRTACAIESQIICEDNGLIDNKHKKKSHYESVTCSQRKSDFEMGRNINNGSVDNLNDFKVSVYDHLSKINKIKSQSVTKTMLGIVNDYPEELRIFKKPGLKCTTRLTENLEKNNTSKKYGEGMMKLRNTRQRVTLPFSQRKTRSSRRTNQPYCKISTDEDEERVRNQSCGTVWCTASQTTSKDQIRRIS